LAGGKAEGVAAVESQEEIYPPVAKCAFSVKDDHYMPGLVHHSFSLKATPDPNRMQIDS
jgi:hypothetical protein